MSSAAAAPEWWPSVDFSAVRLEKESNACESLPLALPYPCVPPQELLPLPAKLCGPVVPQADFSTPSPCLSHDVASRAGSSHSASANSPSPPADAFVSPASFASSFTPALNLSVASERMAVSSEHIKRLSDDFAKTLMAGMDSSSDEDAAEAASRPAPTAATTPSTQPAANPPPRESQGTHDSDSDVIATPFARGHRALVVVDSESDGTPQLTCPSCSPQSDGTIHLTAVKARAGRVSLESEDGYMEDGWLVADGDVDDAVSDCSDTPGATPAPVEPAEVGEAAPAQSGPGDDMDAIFASSKSKKGKAQRRDAVARLLPLFNEAVFDGVLPTDLRVEWSNTLRRTAGLTYSKLQPGQGRVARIELSSKVCDTGNRVASTLLHELCHVAAWLVDGVNKPPHGRVFKAWAQRATDAFPHWEVSTTHSFAIRYKYTYACVECGTSYGRHSKSIDTATQRCGQCMGALVLGGPQEPAWLGQAPASAPRTPKAATGFAAFVKEQYSAVRSATDGPAVSHKEAMQTLSAMWKSQPTCPPE